MRALDVKGGRRIAELRAVIPECPPPEGVLRQLQLLEGEGSVRVGADGRWTLTKAGRKSLEALEVLSVQRGALQFGPDGLPLVYDPGAPEVRADGTFALDASQRPVVHAAASARQIVEAGPGFGKTAVLCARVAWLLEQGVTAPNILVLSFTRTAVRELRNRVRELTRQGIDTGGIEIRTLDSWAWGIRKTGTDARAASYEQSILEVVAMLSDLRGELGDYIGGYEHVFIDEAQDLVGARARLVQMLLGKVRAECGYTVFLDPAQAIYDWADESDAAARVDNSFEKLLDALTPQPERRELAVLHRTRDAALRHLLLGARQVVLGGISLRPLPRVRAVLEARATGDKPAGEELVADLRGRRSDALVLFRRRREVLDASSWLAGASPPVPHRLRFGALPPVVAPWVAMVLHDAFVACGQVVVPKVRFEEAWAGISDSRHTAGWTFTQAWRALRRMGNQPNNAIDVRRVAAAVAIRRVPDEVLLKEIGPAGPILGTVHGSKGREADEVVFFLPEPWEGRESGPEQDEQEARVLYVGLSRAKERLDIRPERPLWSGSLKSGRVFQKQQKGAFRVEIGREGDLDVCAGLATGGDRQQAWLRSHEGAITDLVGLLATDRGGRWEMRAPASLQAGEPLVVGVLGPNACEEIRLAAGGGERKAGTHEELRHVRMMDVTTVALDPEVMHHDRAALPEPWRTLGVWLSPVIVGLGRSFARYSDR